MINQLLISVLEGSLFTKNYSFNYMKQLLVIYCFSKMKFC